MLHISQYVGKDWVSAVNRFLVSRSQVHTFISLSSLRHIVLLSIGIFHIRDIAIEKCVIRRESDPDDRKSSTINTKRGCL